MGIHIHIYILLYIHVCKIYIFSHIRAFYSSHFVQHFRKPHFILSHTSIHTYIYMLQHTQKNKFSDSKPLQIFTKSSMKKKRWEKRIQFTNFFSSNALLLKRKLFLFNTPFLMQKYFFITFLSSNVCLLCNLPKIKTKNKIKSNNFLHKCKI